MLRQNQPKHKNRVKWYVYDSFIQVFKSLEFIDRQVPVAMVASNYLEDADGGL